MSYTNIVPAGDAGCGLSLYSDRGPRGASRVARVSALIYQHTVPEDGRAGIKSSTVPIHPVSFSSDDRVPSGSVTSQLS